MKVPDDPGAARAYVHGFVCCRLLQKPLAETLWEIRGRKCDFGALANLPDAIHQHKPESGGLIGQKRYELLKFGNRVAHQGRLDGSNIQFAGTVHRLPQQAEQDRNFISVTVMPHSRHVGSGNIGRGIVDGLLHKDLRELSIQLTQLGHGAGALHAKQPKAADGGKTALS